VPWRATSRANRDPGEAVAADLMAGKALSACVNRPGPPGDTLVRVVPQNFVPDRPDTRVVCKAL
jgi:hypothetical protein